jgi:hypothetical protein
MRDMSLPGRAKKSSTSTERKALVDASADTPSVSRRSMEGSVYNSTQGVADRHAASGAALRTVFEQLAHNVHLA